MRHYLIILVAIAALIGLLHWRFPYAIKNGDDFMQVLYYLTIATMVGASAFASIRQDLGRSARHALIWVAIFSGLILVAGFYDEVLNSRFMSELIPGRPQVTDEGDLSLRMGEDGHFHVEAKVNGERIKFMVDTGASDTMLSPRDAQRAGFHPDSAAFSRPYNTANGTVMGAPVTLATVEIGPLAFYDVPASINGAAVEESLLGMSFLKLFKGYEVEGNRLILKVRQKGASPL